MESHDKKMLKLFASGMIANVVLCAILVYVGLWTYQHVIVPSFGVPHLQVK